MALDLVPAQVLITGPMQGNFDSSSKGKDILDVVTCVTPLSCQSSSSSNDGGVFILIHRVANDVWNSSRVWTTSPLRMS